MDTYRIAFIGHSKINDKHRLEAPLDEIITEKIHSNEQVELCFCGDGDFDILASVSAITVQRTVGNQNSRRVMVLPCHTKDDWFFERAYDEVRYPVDPATDAETAIAKMNQWVVEHIDLLVAYVESECHDSAWTALKYAEKKGVNIINLAVSS